MFSIGLDWQRDTKGYRLAEMGRYGQFVVRNGGDLIGTEPLAKYDLHYAEFARVKTAEQLLKFVNRWGFLEEESFGGGMTPSL